MKSVLLQARALNSAMAGLFCLGILSSALQALGAEYFVNKEGSDASNGASRVAAFLTIQQGVNALQPGDTLTIGPGEYYENVKLSEFGDLNKETLIRAEIPGTVVLRGDLDAELDFAPVPGLRFVYAADCTLPAVSVQEADTLTNLAEAANQFALQFGPGRFFHDADAGKLYVSSSDFQSPQGHRYTVGILKGHGFHMFKCRRVVLDGLAASAYRTPVEKEVLLLPVSGFMLHECQQCMVRNCTAYFSGAGIAINSGIGSYSNRPGEGRENLVEDCVAYANRLDGIVAYNPACETIHNCRSFLNQIYGARFYAGRGSDEVCLMKNVITWGNPSADVWMKGTGLSEELGNYKTRAIAEGCVAFKTFNVGAIRNCIIGGGDVYNPDWSTSITMPAGHEDFHEFMDANFADPLNNDFRLQGDSSYVGKTAGGTHVGAYAYAPNVYYVKPAGNDARDGLSMTNAWKTPAAAVRKLKPGDTLYIAPGRYAGDLSVNARDVRIRGRGLYPVFIAGGLNLADCESVSVNRIQFSGPVNVSGGKDVELANCIFAGSAARAEKVEALRVTHNVFASALNLQGCVRAVLSANAYVSAPAVSTDSLDAVAYSSYNSYPDAERCWTAGGKVLSLEALRPRHDAYASLALPALENKNGGVVVANESDFSGRGPLSTSIGPYREWKPKQVDVMGPFVESRGGASADVEWWSTLPVEVELRWGDTPDCANRMTFEQNAFYSYSLLDLQPGKKYYVQVVPASISSAADPARRFRLSAAEIKTVEFIAGRAQPHAPTTYYVALDGNDDADGLSRQTAWRSIQAAADRVRPGDTVLLAGGVYPGTFYFRASGEPDKPITVKAVPGEQVRIDGLAETLKAGFVLYGKHHYRLDSLYFTGYSGIEDNAAGAEGAALAPRNCTDLQVTRCSFSNGWGRCVEPRNCPGLVLRNCVFMNSMEAVMIYSAPNLVIENCVFISPLITHLHVYNHANQPATVRRCIFGENTRGKVHAAFMNFNGALSENCFYVRWPESDRKLIGSGDGVTLPQYKAAHGDDGSLVANPHMPGAHGFRRGWQRIDNARNSEDPYDPITFDRFFPTNPEIVLRGIGLQPEAFSDSPFAKDWPYDREWAAKVKAAMDAADALSNAGNAAQAAAAYVKLVRSAPMGERLKTEVMDRAAQCAAEAKDYEQAMDIARNIPIQVFEARRQMGILCAQKKFQEVIKAYSEEALNQHSPTEWVCPEDEMVLGDVYYYRGMAYAETGDLKRAETDMRTMIDKGAMLEYQPGPSVLNVAWKRLGDFYRDRMRDDAKAQEAYKQAR